MVASVFSAVPRIERLLMCGAQIGALKMGGGLIFGEHWPEKNKAKDRAGLRTLALTAPISRDGLLSAGAT